MGKMERFLSWVWSAPWEKEIVRDVGITRRMTEFCRVWCALFAHIF